MIFHCTKTMFILHEHRKLLTLALMSLVNKNIKKCKLPYLLYTDIPNLPKQQNRKNLKNIYNWIKGRSEIKHNLKEPFLFFDPYTGYKFTELTISKYFDNTLTSILPPLYMIDVLKVLQYFCGLPFSIIHNLPVNAYSITHGELTVNSLNIKGEGFHSIKNYYVGSYKVKKKIIKTYKETKTAVFLLPRVLQKIMNNWLLFRGQLEGPLLWRSSEVFRVPNAKEISGYLDYIYTFMPKPPSLFSVEDMAVIEKVSETQIYANIAKEKYPVVMYKNITYICTTDILNLL